MQNPEIFQKNKAQSCQKEHSEVYSQKSMPLPKLTSYRKLAQLQIFRYDQQFQTLL